MVMLACLLACFVDKVEGGKAMRYGNGWMDGCLHCFSSGTGVELSWRFYGACG